MRDFHKLQVWQKAHALVLEIYMVTREFPQSELYGLTSQLRRAAMSIPSNIAEGCGRNSENELLRFMVIAQGSTSEVEYQLLLAKDLGWLKVDKYDEFKIKVNEIKRMLFSYQKRIKETY
jgi:four helix bundle protein